MATSAASTRPSGTKKGSSPLWTVLGLALVQLVAARRNKAPGPASALQRRGSEARSAGRAGRGAERGRPPETRDSKSHAGRDAERKAETEKDRGRAAESPTEVPARGWKDILWRTYEEMNNDRILAVAAGVTYFGILALFPAITALVSLYGLFADATTINEHLQALSGILPGGAMEIIADQVKRIASQGGGTLGFAFFFGLALALWSANAGMKALFDALNVAYDEQEKRGFISLNLQSLAFTLGAIVFILLAVGGIVVIPVVLNFIGLGAVAEWILWLARWPALLAGVVLALAVLYRYGPSRDTVEWKWITPGSILAAVVWLIPSMLFSWYVANFGSYNETYGSLGAAIGFMTWMWLSTTIVLVGAELNAEIEHQTAKDTTEGPSQPLGRRGAEMADTVGEAKT
ncbi:MAG: YihY/virulence factor BrkB family protein [Pseudomonadota bacterium]|nr:YihY/virulence factor BrkB family protein [Pseudomonadota bacterium]